MRALIVVTGIFTICVLSLPDRGAPLGQREVLTGPSGLSASVTRPAAIRKDVADSRCPGARKGLRFYQSSTWRWQTQRDAPRSRAGSALRSRSCAFVRWAARLWQTRAREARSAFIAWFTRTYEKWRCVHEREGAWNDPNAPHWGGLQFDLDFQRTYGGSYFSRWGTADRWPVWAQLIAAERAYNGYAGYGPRFFFPWPNTARACGLIR